MSYIKKNRAIVFCGTKDISFAIASVMMDVVKYSRFTFDEFVIIHDGIGKKDKLKLSNIYQTRFIKYDFPLDARLFHDGTLNYFTKMVYAKFEVFKLLNDYHQVIYTDYDIVLRDDISELLDEKISFKAMFSKEGIVKDQFHEPVKDYDMEKAGISAALMILHDSLPDYMNIYNWCYQKTKELASLLKYPEQGIFDLALQEFHIDTEVIESDPYCSHPLLTPHADEAKILHAWGRTKFWNGLQNDQFDANYERWLAMGGSRFKQKPRWPLHVRIKRKIMKIMGLKK